MTETPPDVGPDAARLELLLRASELLGASLDFSHTLANLAALLVPQIADGYVVDVVAEDGRIQRVAAVDADPALAETMDALMHLAPPNPDAPNGIERLLANGAPILAERMTDEGLAAGARDPAHLALLRRVAPRSGIIAPLRARERSFGMLWLYMSSSGRTYGARDLAFVEAIAARAALALDNARLYREAQAAIHARDDFLALASHELRTPMTSLVLRVQSYARTLRRTPRAVPSDEIVAWLTAYNQQLGRVNRMIDQLLDVSRMRERPFDLEREPMDLGEAVSDVVGRMVDEAQRRGCALRLTAEPGVLGAWDRDRIEQIVLHVIENAIKYGEGAPVEITVARAGEGESARGVITVRDHGMGIDPAHLERIFQRFERLVSSRNYGGFGLGLWMARKAVEAHGGEIHAESRPGEGATFEIRLPLA